MPATQVDPLSDLIAETLTLPPEQLDDQLAMGDLPQWDSVSHVNLIMALEKVYGLTVTPEIITRLTTVAAIRQEIAQCTPDNSIKDEKE